MAIKMEKNCDDCKFDDLASFVTPCCECTEDNFCWRDEEKRLGECGTYKYQNMHEDLEPCVKCISYDEWKATESTEEQHKECSNCKYFDLLGAEDPCCNSNTATVNS